MAARAPSDWLTKVHSAHSASPHQKSQARGLLADALVRGMSYKIEGARFKANAMVRSKHSARKVHQVEVAFTRDGGVTRLYDDECSCKSGCRCAFSD